MHTGPFWYEIDHCLTDEYRQKMLKVAKKAAPKVPARKSCKKR